MFLNVDVNNGQFLEGDFAVATETGPDADQTGTVQGSIVGNSLNATCELADGTSIQLTGTSSSSGLELTRSDFPGTVLHFTPGDAAESGRRASGCELQPQLQRIKRQGHD